LIIDLDGAEVEEERVGAESEVLRKRPDRRRRDSHVRRTKRTHRANSEEDTNEESQRHLEHLSQGTLNEKMSTFVTSSAVGACLEISELEGPRFDFIYQL